MYSNASVCVRLMALSAMTVECEWFIYFINILSAVLPSKLHFSIINMATLTEKRVQYNVKCSSSKLEKLTGNNENDNHNDDNEN